MEIKIAPSILSADFGRLAEEVGAITAAGCDYVHVDVMDGRFVPNITIGQPVVAALRRVTTAPLDVHLMVEAPERYVESFAQAGADIITVHVEATTHVHRTLQAIRATGKRAGISLNPATPLTSLDWILDDVDLILVMSVNPGFGGQRFIGATLDKLRALRERLDGRDVEVEVDGGVGVDNIAEIAQAGADVFVSGTGIFGGGDYAATIADLRRRCASLPEREIHSKTSRNEEVVR
ncbi:MAG: ribulose-phosphate 3-epimerase [Deltaproteobacteria bacterium]|nr:ribulose-phosphate 3-epimerase [Deltaproteobacteria bacterium]